MKKLNLGCGKDILKDHVNIDFVKSPGVDIVFDLNKKRWPFKDNEFDEIFCSHILEHIDTILDSLNEIYRISKPGAIIKIKAPYYCSSLALGDLTHKNRFCYRTFEAWSIDKKGEWTDYGLNVKFRILKRKIYFLETISSRYKLLFKMVNAFFNSFINLFPLLYERNIYFILPSQEIYYELKVIKKRVNQTEIKGGIY